MSTAREPMRIGVVSFVNTLPLIDGLEFLREVELCHSVPSLLLDRLTSGEVELALCSSIDYQRSPEPLVVLPVGQLGCSGPTLTVRLYATRPIESIERVFCDTDSHTSVVLMRILLRDQFGVDPELVDYDAREHVAEGGVIDWPDAMLLIGDKVVTDSPPAVRYPYQLDLGEAWHQMTGLPFVFALWLALRTTDPERLDGMAAILEHRRRFNRTRIDSIIHHRAVPRGWPRDLAAQYLGSLLDYELTDRHRAGLARFYERAAEHGLIDAARPIELHAPAAVS